jgi:hypothetical protein
MRAGGHVFSVRTETVWAKSPKVKGGMGFKGGKEQFGFNRNVFTKFVLWAILPVGGCALNQGGSAGGRFWRESGGHARKEIREP